MGPEGGSGSESFFHFLHYEHLLCKASAFYVLMHNFCCLLHLFTEAFPAASFSDGASEKKSLMVEIHEIKIHLRFT